VPAAGKPVADADAHADKVGSGIAAPGFAFANAIAFDADRPGGGRRSRMRQ
jgi:hypothetical protein